MYIETDCKRINGKTWARNNHKSRSQTTRKQTICIPEIKNIKYHRNWLWCRRPGILDLEPSQLHSLGGSPTWHHPQHHRRYSSSNPLSPRPRPPSWLLPPRTHSRPSAAPLSITSQEVVKWTSPRTHGQTPAFFQQKNTKNRESLHQRQKSAQWTERENSHFISKQHGQSIYDAERRCSHILMILIQSTEKCGAM